MNPFGVSHYGFLSGAMLEQIKGMKVGETKKLDMHGHTIPSCRTALTYVSGKEGMKIRTKKDVYGELWVKRIA